MGNATGMIPSPEEQSKYVTTVNVFLVLLVCAVMVYVCRVCWAGIFVGKPSGRFPTSRIINDKMLVDNLDIFRTLRIDKQILHQVIENIADEEKHSFVIFFNLLQKGSSKSFAFDFDVGTRLCVPGENQIDQGRRRELADAIKSSSSKEESYI